MAGSYSADLRGRVLAAVEAGATPGAAALLPRPSPRLYGRKLDGEQEAHLLALACARPPEGKARWSLRLLAERMVELEHVDALSHETARQTLKKTSSGRI